MPSSSSKIDLSPVSIHDRPVVEEYSADHRVNDARWVSAMPDGKPWQDYELHPSILPQLKNLRDLPRGMRILNPLELMQVFAGQQDEIQNALRDVFARGIVKCGAENSHYFSVIQDADGHPAFHRPGYAGGTRANIMIAPMGTPGDDYTVKLCIDDGRTGAREAVFRSIGNVDDEIVTLPDRRPVVTF